jgi:RHS repeat-associated protein
MIWIVGRNVHGKGIDEPSEWGAREMDGQACEGSRRAEPERTSQILMRTYGAQTYYFQQDQNGNVTHLTNATGAIVEKYKYDAFGAVTIYNGSGVEIPTTGYNNRFYFTGREYAAWSTAGYNAGFKFYEYRARAYNPTLGRFMSEDPKGFDAGDYNLFRYCHNDPLDLTDPMGLGDEQVNAQMVKAGYANLAMHAQMVLPPGSNIPVWAVQLPNAQWVDSRAAGLTMGQMSQSERGMHTYSLKSQYNIGDLSGARGFQYVWDPNEKFNGQCMTTIQHLSGAPSSSTPLLRGAPVGPNTRQGTAVATGFELNSRGQWVYPSKPATQSNNHAAFYVAPIGGGRMQTLKVAVAT